MNSPVRFALPVFAAALAALVPARARASSLTKFFSGTPAAPQIITRDFPAAGVKSIEAEVGIGDIMVQGAAGAAPSIQVDIADDDPKVCVIAVGIEGGTLRLSAHGTNHWFWQADNCRADFTVRASGGLPVQASAGQGDVSLADLRAGAKVQVGSGNALLNDVAGALTARVGSGLLKGQAGLDQADIDVGNGSVTLSGLAGSVQAKVGNGIARLEWAKLPDQGSAEVNSGNGGVALVFPGGSKIQTHIVSGMGSVDNEIGDTSGAGFLVSVTAGLGNVSIKAAQ